MTLSARPMPSVHSSGAVHCGDDLPTSRDHLFPRFISLKTLKMFSIEHASAGRRLRLDNCSYYLMDIVIETAVMPRRKKAAHETVLVVDDDPQIRESLSELLDYKGYSVLQAENGRRALDVLKAVPPRTPCIVVLDLAMPVLDG